MSLLLSEMVLLKDLKTPCLFHISIFPFFHFHPSCCFFFHLSFVLLRTSTSPLFPVYDALYGQSLAAVSVDPARTPIIQLELLLMSSEAKNINVSLGNNADEAEQQRPSEREETAALQSFPTDKWCCSDSYLGTCWCWCFRAAWVLFSARHLHWVSKRRQAAAAWFMLLGICRNSGDAPTGDASPDAGCQVMLGSTIKKHFGAHNIHIWNKCIFCILDFRFIFTYLST